MSNQAPDSLRSNAFNFSGFVSGGVDPRTGVYTCAFTLGAIASADLNGPSFNLALGFNPLNTRNAGYGTGWSLSTSRYDVRSNVMTLANGETYKASETSKALLFKEMKLESARVLKVGNGLYEVRYKDGRREELKLHGATNVAVPRRIIAANGASITLKYATFNEQPMLVEIMDANRTLLKVSRTAGRLTITQYPDTPSSAQFTMTFKNERVTSIGLPVGRGWDLLYEVIDGISYLKRVDSPLGAVEIIRYNQTGHLLPTLEGVRSLPYVIAHDIFARQGQPKVAKTYTYSDHNYLGHGVPSDPVDDGDPLYRAPGSYQYSSTEQLIVGEKIHTRIKRTYNKFHLLVTEVTTCGESVSSVATEYHGDVNKPFTEQPAQFQMPKVQTRRYENTVSKKTRTETSITEFDAAGNLVKEVQTNGVTTRYEYYPDADSVDCPKDPLGFIRFLKKKTVVPAAGGGASTITRYRYALQPALEGATVANVVPVQERYFEWVKGSEVLRSTVDMTYLNTPKDSATHGALRQQSITRNATTTRIEYSYVLVGMTLVLKKTVHGFDGTSSATEQTLSTLSGLTLSERDADDCVIEFEYDKLGRCLRKTVAPGTTNASSTRWSYQAAEGNSPSTMITADPSGGVQKATYDALGRLVAIHEKDCDSPDPRGVCPMRMVYTAFHDQTGQPVKVTRGDWREGLAREFESELLYDGWGQVKETRHGDGRIEHSEFDPISRQHQRWQQGMGKTVTKLNAFGKPDSVEVFDLKEQSLGKTVYAYDGLGRTLSQTDPAGNTTSYEYDVFDRMFRSVLPDLDAVETTFAAHSTDDLPAVIKVAGLSLGQRKFDGLNRVIENSVGGRKSLIHYDAGRSQPKSHTNPAGQKTEFVHAPELGGQLIERRAVIKGDDYGLITRFTYDALNGKTKSCIEQGRERHFEYFPSGRLKSETTRYGEQRRTVSHTYSFAGLPLTHVDVLGTKHTTEYDMWGRRISFRQGSVQAGFFYDKRGLLEKIETHDTSSRHLLTTRLGYDDIGREVSRSFEVNGLPTQTLTSSYTVAGKLAQRVLKRGALVLRDERFTYDVRGRLSQYDCDGSQRPKDPYGKEIVQQKFTFNALDNILSLQTTFPQGVNVTTFSFSQIDPAQLVGVTHSHADYPAPVTLEYDADGRMIKDDQARTLAYDAFGRLIQVSNARGEVVRGYHYDGFDRLVELSQPRMLDVQRYYHNANVSSEIRGGDAHSIVRHGGLLLGQQQSGGDAGSRIFGTDQQHSVLTQLHGGQWEDSAYSPYGHRPAEGGFFSLAGFNGEQLDAVTGLYLLGNGYRAYSPTLMRFTSPDSMSPFGAGGLNAYAYCLGDPINRVDPTGHFSWSSIAGIALGVIGIALSIGTLGAATPLALLGAGLGIASGVTGIGSILANELDPRSPAGDILGYISLGLGLASLGAGLAARAVQAANRLVGGFKSGLSVNPREAARAMASGMAGRSTQGARAAPERWTFKTYRFKGALEGKKTGKGAINGFDSLSQSEVDKYYQFKNAIVEQGMTPTDAASMLGTRIKYKELIPFKSATAYERADPDFFNKTGLTEIRLGGAKRLFFYADRDTRTLTAYEFGHTLAGS